MSGSQDNSFNAKYIGIVGEGKMGTGIFHYLLDFPFQIKWICSRNADIEKIRKQFSKRIQRQFDHGIIGPERLAELKMTVISKELSDITGCDLVIEAIPEVIELKKILISDLNLLLDPDAMIVSNSSSIKPSLLLSGSKRCERFAGLHFFYPVALKNIVELVTSDQTSEDTIFQLEEFLDRIHRRFIRLSEQNGFMLNKIFLEVQNEAFKIVRSGICDYRQIDELVRSRMFEFGIFDFCDSVGIDTMRNSILNYTADYPNKMDYQMFAGQLNELEKDGKCGVRSGHGFYPYPYQPGPARALTNSEQVFEHLYNTWLMAVRRFAMQSHLAIDDLNHAVIEYFGLQHGPFDRA
jgi:3-hydroxybutyryl-CoA dehydrogenase